MNSNISPHEYNEICKLLNVVSNMALIENAPKTRGVLIEVIEVFRQIGDYGKPVILKAEIDGLSHLFNILQLKGLTITFEYDQLKASNTYIKKASILWPCIKELDKLTELKNINFEIRIGDKVLVFLNSAVLMESEIL